MFKRIISAILLTSMLMVLAACSGSGKASVSPTPSTTTPAPTKSEPVEVVFWDMVVGGQKYPGLAEKLAAEATKDLPNIKIKYQSIPWANRYETFSTAIAAHTGPDFSTGGGYQSFQFAGANEIMDISSVVDQWKANGTLKNYDENLIKYFQYKGMQVGIPWNYEPRYILYIICLEPVFSIKYVTRLIVPSDPEN
jgi:ABC-type glycerol-3-phosphate transport system substrate-binding protein